jgi:hypothetical protein
MPSALRNKSPNHHNPIRLTHWTPIPHAADLGGSARRFLTRILLRSVHRIRRNRKRSDLPRLPIYLDDDTQRYLADRAQAKGIDVASLVNQLLKKDVELIEAAR